MDMHLKCAIKRCLILWIFYVSLEFLVSELQAARIINYLEMYPEEKTMEEESEKQKRVKEEGLSHELTELCGEGIDGAGVLDEERRRGEMQAEWILLLRALDMNASSQFADVLSEVSLGKTIGFCMTLLHFCDLSP